MQREDAADSRISRTDGARFVAFDRVLDALATGPQWLIRPDVARAVSDVLVAGRCKGLYELGSWVLMPNHVHVILHPLVDLSRVFSGIKVTSAMAGQSTAGQNGCVPEQENNPVKAGLCREPVDWPFSSASAQYSADSRIPELAHAL